MLARPTRKMGLFRQMIGRVLRPAPNKPDAIVIDHSGAVYRHGFAEDRVEWTLDPERKAENPTHAKRERTRHPFAAGRLLAMRCAAHRRRSLPTLRIQAGTAAEVRSDDRRRSGANPSQRPQRRRVLRPGRARSWHAQLAYIAQERGYKPGWAAYKFKEKFGAVAKPPVARTDPADAGSPVMGALAHDRLREIAKQGAA